MMYQHQQQIYMFQLSEDQLRQHYQMKKHVNEVKRGDGGQQVYSQNNNNNRTNYKKKQSHNQQSQWSNNYKNLGLVSEQAQETLCPRPSSRDSQTDSSCEDLNDLANKGVKRIHEVNGAQQQLLHSFAVNSQLQPLQTYQVPQQQHQRSHSPQSAYSNYKRRYNVKFGGSNSPPHTRRDKPHNATNGFQLTWHNKPVPERYLARGQQIEVKETPELLVTGSQWDQLSTEIWHKFISNQQTTEDYVNKLNLFKHLYHNIKLHLRYSVFVVGSTFNGFGTNNSDLDLCLVVRSPQQQQLIDGRTDAIQHLVHTYQLICQLNYATGTGNDFQKLELVEAKIPLLKFRHSSIGVDVDINCNNCVTIRNTHLLHCYAKADWRVQPLVLVVKLWAQVHQINDAKNMTISSYSLALMVIHFLQCGARPAVLPCLQKDFPEKFDKNQAIYNITILEILSVPATSNTQSLGELFLQFLHYYNNFNYGEEAISVRLGKTLPIELCRRFVSPKNEARAWTYLCIEEPFDHTNTARSVYDPEKFEHIKKVFRVSYERLKQTQSLDSIFSMQINP